jgi:hypothetical protein
MTLRTKGLAFRIKSMERHIKSTERRIKSAERRINRIKRRIKSVERRIKSMKRRIKSVERRIKSAKHFPEKSSYQTLKMGIMTEIKAALAAFKVFIGEKTTYFKRPTHNKRFHTSGGVTSKKQECLIRKVVPSWEKNLPPTCHEAAGRCMPFEKQSENKLKYIQ